MQHLRKILMTGALLSGVLVAAGCAGGYGDNGYYYDSNGYRHHDRYDHWRDRDSTNRDRDDATRDRSDNWRDRSDTRERVKVCDSDGDNCHWEYRDR